jgi:hypothetical protein
VPPPYSVATSLPTYDEAEKAKAAAMVLSAVEVIPGVGHTHRHVFEYGMFTHETRIILLECCKKNLTAAINYPV